jgi:hypothetical protein
MAAMGETSKIAHCCDDFPPMALPGIGIAGGN